jgi:flagellar FliL protein
MAAKDDSDALASTPLVPKKSGNSLMPIIAVVVLVPALCYAVMDFVIIPKIKTSLGAPAAPAKADAHGAKKKSDSHAAKSGGHGGGGYGAVDAPAEGVAPFGNIVVNLAGSNNSRFLKATFSVKSEDPNIADIIKKNLPALRDAAISTMSSQEINSQDIKSGRELIRKSLVSQFNRLLGAEVIDTIYFDEFVVQ